MTASSFPPFLIPNWSSAKDEWFLRYKVGHWRQRMAWSAMTPLWWGRTGLQDLNISFIPVLFGTNIPHWLYAWKTEAALKSDFFLLSISTSSQVLEKTKQLICFALNACFFFSNTFLYVISEISSSHWLQQELQPFSYVLVINSCTYISFFFLWASSH